MLSLLGPPVTNVMERPSYISESSTASDSPAEPTPRKTQKWDLGRQVEEEDVGKQHGVSAHAKTGGRSRTAANFSNPQTLETSPTNLPIASFQSLKTELYKGRLSRRCALPVKEAQMTNLPCFQTFTPLA